MAAIGRFQTRLTSLRPAAKGLSAFLRTLRPENAGDFPFPVLDGEADEVENLDPSVDLRLADLFSLHPARLPDVETATP